VIRPPTTGRFRDPGADWFPRSPAHEGRRFGLCLDNHARQRIKALLASSAELYQLPGTDAISGTR